MVEIEIPILDLRTAAVLNLIFEIVEHHVDVRLLVISLSHCNQLLNSVIRTIFTFGYVCASIIPFLGRLFIYSAALVIILSVAVIILLSGFLRSSFAGRLFCRLLCILPAAGNGLGVIFPLYALLRGRFRDVEAVSELQ